MAWCVASKPGRVLRLDVFPILSFACNSPATLSNREFTTLELQRFQTLLKLHPIELHAKFGGRWCRRRPRVAAWPCRPRVSQPGSVGQVGRLSETVVAFTRLCLRGIETAIAFAGEKWAFLLHFACAEVMPVSAVPCWGCAVVLLVSTSTCCRASCAKKFALRGSVIVHARKYSPCTLKTPQNRRSFACWANYFAEEPLEGLCWESFSRQSALSPGLVGDVAREAGCGGGFAALEAGWRRVVGVSGS